jgi:hypothetical protein
VAGTRFYYPTFYRKVTELDNFLRRHQKDMVQLCNITDPELGQLNTLGSALDAIVKSAGWVGYTEQP